MPQLTTIEDFLAQTHLAFVGVSRDTKAFPNSVYRRLREPGRTMYPVNSAAAGAPIEGDPSYQSLADVPDPVDGVIVMVPANSAGAVVADAAARGIPRVWLHRGGGPAVSQEAVQICHDHGIAVVDGTCPLMFEKPVRGVHRFHKMLAGRRVAV